MDVTDDVDGAAVVVDKGIAGVADDDVIDDDVIVDVEGGGVATQIPVVVPKSMLE